MPRFEWFISKEQSLKIIEKVSFNIACEESYVYILSGQKLIKIAKNGECVTVSHYTFSGKSETFLYLPNLNPPLTFI